MELKIIGSLIILISATILGIQLAKFKTERVRQLKLITSALNMLETEIKYALTVLPEIFIKISKIVDKKVSAIFINAAELIQTSKTDACGAWQKSLNLAMPNLSIKEEDKEILMMLGNSLGEVDVENQTKNIKLIIEQLKYQEIKAKQEEEKGTKLFKSLGFLTGLSIIIILF